MKQQKMKVAFIGLGVMGYPMAGHLYKAGYEIRVFNRHKDKAEKWFAEYVNSTDRPDFHASVADSIAQACCTADFVFTCVGNDEDLSEIMLGSAGVLENCQQGALICDHTTSSAKLARKLAEQARNSGLDFLDAPVSGGQMGAQKGQLSIMVGGSQKAFDEVVDVLNCYGKTVRRIGESGSGQLAKMVNQICITGILQGLSEALYFGKHAGLDLEKVLEVISKGAAQSWQMDNRAATMLKGEFDFGFAVDWMIKDLTFVLDEAQAMNMDLALVKQVNEYYKKVQASGGGRKDTSSLITRLEKKSHE